MGILKKADMFLVTASLGIFLVSIVGCASSGQNFQKRNEFESPGQNQLMGVSSNKARPAFDEKKIITEEPLDMTPGELERLGDIYLGRDNLYMAFVQYEKSLNLNPDNIRVRYKKGLVLVSGGLAKDAIEEFKKVLKKEPDYALAYQGLGQAFLEERTYDKAEKNLKKAFELNPKLWKSHNLLGLVYDRQGKHGQAIYEYAAAIRLRPRSGVLYHNLGVSYSQAGDYERAVIAFQKALENRYVDKKVYNTMGLALSKVGRHEEALEAFKKGGGIAQAYNNLGCVYLNEAKFKKAIKCFETAIALNPAFYAKANENLKKARIAALH